MKIETKFSVGDKAWYTDQRFRDHRECAHCGNTIETNRIYTPIEFTVDRIEASWQDGELSVSYDSLEKTDEDGDCSIVFWADEKSCFATQEDAQYECNRKNEEWRKNEEEKN